MGFTFIGVAFRVQFGPVAGAQAVRGLDRDCSIGMPHGDVLLMCLRNCKRFQIYMVDEALATAGNI
jgi:hypothetical protein